VNLTLHLYHPSLLSQEPVASKIEIQKIKIVIAREQLLLQRMTSDCF